jgi:uncharacterized protein
MAGSVMNVSKSFYSELKFWAVDVFPHGMARSGYFTKEQAALLENNGHAYLALSTGDRVPLDQMEKEFVVFCQGKKEADNVHEKCWKRYLDVTSKKRYRHYSVSSSDYGGDSDYQSDMDIL